MKELLIIFVKNAVVGKVKSRLAAEIGRERAHAVYGKLLERTKTIVSGIQVDKLVCYSSEIEPYDLWDSDDFQKDLQKGDNLGMRMYNAIEKAYKDHYQKICLIGSDNMEITPGIILEAFKRLDTEDVVIGPSKDGGYYLIAMKIPVKEIFEISAWSTSTVLEETIATAKLKNIKYYLLEELNDVDELDDINNCDRDFLLS